MENEKFNLHLVSDSTGETIISVARACLAQFENVAVEHHVHTLIRTSARMDRVISAIEAHPGPVLYTLVDDELRTKLDETCRQLAVPSIPLLDRAIHMMANFFGVDARAQPGRQHALDKDYFSRIEAMDYTLAHDDGLCPEEFESADVVLIGVSRSSKTPTSVYLANRGVKTANIPFVPGQKLPESVLNLSRPLVIGLTKDPKQLVQLRRNRLRSLGEINETAYTDIDAIKAEVAEARRLFSEKNWHMIDVTRRSIEETAATIINQLEKKRQREKEDA
jgi:[pyruvate, water dikinase]-phosphate phosphotransferase / [pyruvate, water dikinase] kinase